MGCCATRLKRICYKWNKLDAWMLTDGADGVTAGSSHRGRLQGISFPTVGGGHYLPAAAVTGACALRWLPFAAAVSAARALLGVSREDLRLRAHELSHELSGAFFDRQAAPAAAAAARPFAAVCAARFPEDGLFVCADLPPLRPALLDVQRALLQVAVKDASHGACDWYFDTVGHVMRLLVVGDAGDGRGPAVFDRDGFEAAFALKWVDMDE